MVKIIIHLMLLILLPPLLFANENFKICKFEVDDEVYYGTNCQKLESSKWELNICNSEVRCILKGVEVKKYKKVKCNGKPTPITDAALMSLKSEKLKDCITGE